MLRRSLRTMSKRKRDFNVSSDDMVVQVKKTKDYSHDIDVDSLKTKNLNEIDLYAIFNSTYSKFANKRSYDEFRRRLDVQLDIIRKTYTDNDGDNDKNDDAISTNGIADESVKNSTETILTAANFAHRVLTSSNLKNVYDDYLLKKLNYVDNVQDRGLDKDFAQYRDRLNVVREKAAKLATQLYSFNENETLNKMLKLDMNNNLNMAKNKQPANLAFNRILVTWDVHDKNSVNEGIDEQILETHFNQYGRVNAVVLCSLKPNCAIIEFVSQDSLLRAQNEEKMFIVKDYTETAILNVSINEIVSQVNIIEQKLQSLREINSSQIKLNQIESNQIKPTKPNL